MLFALTRHPPQGLAMLDKIHVYTVNSTWTIKSGTVLQYAHDSRGAHYVGSQRHTSALSVSVSACLMSLAPTSSTAPTLFRMFMSRQHYVRLSHATIPLLCVHACAQATPVPQSVTKNTILNAGLQGIQPARLQASRIATLAWPGPDLPWQPDSLAHRHLPSEVAAVATLHRPASS